MPSSRAAARTSAIVDRHRAAHRLVKLHAEQPSQHGREVFTAAALLSLFKQHDEVRLEEQHAFQHDKAHLIQTAQEATAQLKDLFEADTAYFPRAGAAAAAS